MDQPPTSDRCPLEGWEGVGGPPPPSLGCPIMLRVVWGIKPWRGHRMYVSC